MSDPDAQPYFLDVARSGGSFDVTGMWLLRRPHQRHPWSALAESGDGFRTGRYVGGSYRQLQPAAQRDIPDGAEEYEACSSIAGGADLCFDYDRTQAAWTFDHGSSWTEAELDLGHLLPSTTESVAPDVFAVVGGGDGATLFPFERVVRSVDAGRSWQRFDLPLFDGERAYTSGDVVTSDGRLVTLLDHFSDDRAGRPGRRHHGLWTSAGDDWASYRPLRPRLTPQPQPSPDGWSTITSLAASSDPDPVIWVTTWDHRLYVSTDDARSFREIPAR